MISVADTLDRETNSSYHFVARVSDGIREVHSQSLCTVDIYCMYIILGHC